MRTSESAKADESERVLLESTKRRAGDGNDHKNKLCELPSTWETLQPKEGTEKQLAKVNEEKEIRKRQTPWNAQMDERRLEKFACRLLATHYRALVIV
ncbi:hypothetical protein ACLKA7_009175 [Drosophila subpalustris]